MLERLLTDEVKVAATICLQYGDTGKGKIAHWLAGEWADVNARGTGGANAGHTVIQNGKEVIYHLLPVGIAYDGQGKTTILGNGMAIDPHALCGEIDLLSLDGLTTNGLRIDNDASVVMPWHIKRDEGNKSQAKGGIGSTGRGIGPCYSDRAARIGFTMRDIMSPDAVKNKLEKLRGAYPESASEMGDEKVIEGLRPAVDRLKDYLADTAQIMHAAMKRGRRINLEGAQGTLLSVNHGVLPYVTSSDCAINGTAAGVGISAGAVDLVLGLVKFPFMTRVGAGPFPTERGGRASEDYCAETNPDKTPTHSDVAELTQYGIPYTVVNKRGVYDRRHPTIIQMMNSDDSFIQGIGMRLAGGEYGASTGRPRRTGWTDAVAALYAVNINRPVQLVLTKTDSLAGLKQFKVAYSHGLDDACATTDFSRDERVQRSVKAFHTNYDGYGEIGDVKVYDKLPSSLRESISDFERFTRSRVAVVSVGPKPEQTIVV